MKRLIIVILFICSVSLWAQPSYPTLDMYATDLTNTLSGAQMNRINSALRTFEDSTSNQVVFLMIPSLENYPLDMYSYEVAAKNKIGTKGHDNGILFLVAKNDKKMRIEVGYGLEGALPDALASSILRNEVKPYFKKGDYYSGVVAGLNAILAATIGEYKNDNPHRDSEKDERGFPFAYIIIFILIMIFSRGGRRGGLGSLLLLGALGGMGGGSRGGGGFSGGGGFGGFSGGGGGFGGGGASGGW